MLKARLRRKRFHPDHDEYLLSRQAPGPRCMGLKRFVFRIAGKRSRAGGRFPFRGHGAPCRRQRKDIVAVPRLSKRPPAIMLSHAPKSNRLARILRRRPDHVRLHSSGLALMENPRPKRSFGTEVWTIYP